MTIVSPAPALATPARADGAPAPGSGPVPLLDVAVPIYNEAHVLAASIGRLREFLDRSLPFSAVITIVDNGSSDGSAEEGRRLAAALHDVRYMRIEEKGRGRALRVAWSSSDAMVVAYMDVDLSTGLDALLPLVGPLVFAEAEVAIGSRLAAGAEVVRCAKRECISRAYNLLLRRVLRSPVSDAQCGFKAMSAAVARSLLPQVEDQSWFFDTELLVLAQRRGLRIHEVPVCWTEDRDSRVRIIRTAWDDLMGVIRLLVRRHPAAASG